MVKKAFYVAGAPAGKESSEDKWEARVDKDPFYRTMDIFNGVFKKRVKLSTGPINCTDLHTIYVNFGELRRSKIVQNLRQGKDTEHVVFLLECGHEWIGKRLRDGKLAGAGDWGVCSICGSDTVYRGFEHEWQHIIFKSDLAARAIFCSEYADQLLAQIPQNSIDKAELIQFLNMLVNAFDDIRVNSLWEKVYPGSAMAIWERWRCFVAMMENTNTSFLAFIFAVAFDIPTNQQSEFEPLKPVIQWAIEQVKYRGFINMLLDVRIVMDRCMGAILAKMKPPPPPKLQPPPPPSLTLPPPPTGGSLEQGNDNAEEDKDAKQEGHRQSSGQEVQSGQESQRDPEGKSNGGDLNQEDKEETSVGGVPSSSTVLADDQERQQALSRLMQQPQQLDPKEEHSAPASEDLEAANKSQSLRAALTKILHKDISTLDNDEGPDGIDSEMQTQLDQLQSGITQKSETSQLIDGAKAKLTIIKVTKAGTGTSVIEIQEGEREIIKRLRAAFFRTMGKQKAKRSSQGNSVDVEALIQYLGDHQDSSVFENEDINQGFAYSVLCDMSGSMVRTFPTVCRAVEMLKHALNYPFVVGNLWGFRGGYSISDRKFKFRSSEVWMYQYDRDVNWYTGTVPFRLYPGPRGVFQVPVECDGSTPMNSAINVAANHLWRKMPAGMSKRLFILTDGSPVHSRVTGHGIPEFLLRQFVANEIRKARKHGIEVYTLVIGEHAIEEDKCLQMFGAKKFWNRVGKEQIGTVLLSLVLRNFTRYLRRG